MATTAIKVLLEVRPRDSGVGRFLSKTTAQANEFADAMTRAAKSARDLGDAKFTMPRGGGGGRGGGRGGGGGAGGGAGPVGGRAGAGRRRRREQRDDRASAREGSARARRARERTQRDRRRERAESANFRRGQGLADRGQTGGRRRRRGGRGRRRGGMGPGGEVTGPDLAGLSADLSRSAAEIDAFASGVQGALTEAFNSFKDYEKGVIEVSTLTDNISVEDIKKITTDAALQFGSLPTEQVAAFYSIVSAGATNATEAQEQLIAANQLAVGGVATQEESVLAISKAIANFGGSSEDAADSLFTAVQKGQVTVSQMAQALPQVAQTAGAAALTLDETNAALALLSLRSGSAKKAATNLNNAMTQFIAPTEAGKAVLDDINKRLEDTGKSFRLDLGASAIKASGGLVGWIQTVKKAGVTDEELKKIFGGDGFKAIRGMVKGVDDLKVSLDESFSNKAGAAMEANAKIMASSSKKAEILEAQWEVLKITAGEALVPALTELATQIGPIITDVTEWMKANPELTNTLAKVAIGTVVVGKGIGALGSGLSVITGVMGIGSTAVDGLAVAYQGIVRVGPKVVSGIGRMTAALGPMGVAAVAIALVVGGLILSLRDDMAELDAELDRLDERNKESFAFKTEEGKELTDKEIFSEQRARLVRDAEASQNVFSDAQFTDPARDIKRQQALQAQSSLARFDEKFGERAGVSATDRADIDLITSKGIADMVALLKEQKATADAQLEATKNLAASPGPQGASLEAGLGQ